MNEEERRRLAKKFATLSENVLAPEVQTKVEQEVREELAGDAREHARFLAASRRVAHKRFVR